MLTEPTALAPAPEVRDRAAYRALASESRQALLAALRRVDKPLDADEAGAAVGLHPNTARVHLELLCSAGVLERRTEDRTKRGRPRVRGGAEPASTGVPTPRDPGCAPTSMTRADPEQGVALSSLHLEELQRVAPQLRGAPEGLRPVQRAHGFARWPRPAEGRKADRVQVDVGRVYNELGGPPAHRALVERLWRGAIPGINGSFDLNDPSVAGQRFSGECTQLCGTHHRFVRSWVQVVPKDKFNTWLRDYHGPGAATAEGSS